MAEVKIYRAVYTYLQYTDEKTLFSEWVEADGMDEVLANLHDFNTRIEPTVIGWEEKILDTDPGEE